MATVSIYLREDRINRNGECPIQIKVKHSGSKALYLPVDSVKVKPEYWDQSTYTVALAHPNAKEINDKIQHDKLAVEKAILQLSTGGHGFNRDMLKAKLGGYQEHDVYDFWERTIKSRGVKLSSNTIRNYGVNLRKLQQFRKSLTFNEITIDFLEQLEAWCIKKGNKPNTISKLTKNISYMVSRANVTIGLDNKVFNYYKIPGEETVRDVFSLTTLDKFLRCLGSVKSSVSLSRAP